MTAVQISSIPLKGPRRKASPSPRLLADYSDRELLHRDGPDLSHAVVASKAAREASSSSILVNNPDAYIHDEWADISRERPLSGCIDSPHADVPEDHLEDLVRLPIAQELVPRRPKQMLPVATGPSHAPTIVSPQFESNDAESASSLVDDYTPSGTSTQVHHDRKRVRVQSSPLLGGEKQGIRSQNVIQPDASFTGRSSPLRLNPSATAPNLYNKVGKLPARSDNAPASSKKQSSRSVTDPLSPRRPHGSSRQRAKSTSTPAPPVRALDDSTEHEYPPISQDEPMYLSDLQSWHQNSLAGIAAYAREARLREGPAGGRYANSSDSSNSMVGQSAQDITNTRPDALRPLADTSTRSWDDMILPAVAKRIRQEQLQAEQAGASINRVEPTLQDDTELIVTECHVDGSPKRWKRVRRKVERSEGSAIPPNVEYSFGNGVDSALSNTQDSGPALKAVISTSALKVPPRDEEPQHSSGRSDRTCSEDRSEVAAVFEVPASARHPKGRTRDPTAAVNTRNPTEQTSATPAQPATFTNLASATDAHQTASDAQAMKPRLHDEERDKSHSGWCKCVIM